MGIGAQFGSKCFCHDVRVIRLRAMARLPHRHWRFPLGRQALGKITRDGVFVEQLNQPAQYLPDVDKSLGGEVVTIDLNQPWMKSAALSHPIKTRVSLTGTIIVARDIARQLQELDRGEGLPDYFKNARLLRRSTKTPDGMASGSFGPTTASRMDSYVAPFMAAGGSHVMLAKQRSPVVRCPPRTWRFLSGSIGGCRWLTLNGIKVEVQTTRSLAWKRFGRSREFPGLYHADDKGNDFFANI